jgi:hypothetical protein
VLKRVLHAQSVMEYGANNPLVEDGIFVVDGAVASTFVNSTNKYVGHWVAYFQVAAHWQYDITQLPIFGRNNTDPVTIAFIDSGAMSTIFNFFSHRALAGTNQATAAKVAAGKTVFDVETFRTEMTALADSGTQFTNFLQITSVIAEDRLWS